MRNMWLQSIKCRDREKAGLGKTSCLRLPFLMSTERQLDSNSVVSPDCGSSALV